MGAAVFLADLVRDAGKHRICGYAGLTPFTLFYDVQTCQHYRPF
jgi:hypothetical protein